VGRNLFGTALQAGLYRPNLINYCKIYMFPTRSLCVTVHSYQETHFSEKCLATTANNPKNNHLLAALPGADWQRWLPNLELLDMHMRTWPRR
jgi:hypothetical protein